MLFVMGSTEELGNWEEFKCGMKWTEGHYWVTDNLIIKSAPYFQYKYVTKSEGLQDAVWEKGMDRIADLAILSPLNDS